MANYLRPDVYIERLSNGVASIESSGTSTAGMIGTSARGKVGQATIVTSWTDYVNKFALGLASPFSRSSDLAYSVFGYFQNGGSVAVITRVTDGTDTKAQATITTSIVVEALDSGTWANNHLEIEIVAVEDTFNLLVKMDGEVVELFENVTEDADSENYVIGQVNDTSKYINIKSAPIVAVGSSKFEGGTDGLTSLEDTHYLEGLNSLDLFESVSLVAISGQTSKTVNQGILDYCEKRGDCFAVIDLPIGLSTEEVIEYKKGLGGHFGACYYPWGKVVDPLGKGKLRLTPPSGHILGVYANTDSLRGVHKAPAGLEARVKGFVETERPLANGDIELLNPLGINCIVPKVNKGIVVWGARLISSHLDRKYVSDMRLDIDIEKSLYLSTQWTLFEPNDEALWNKLVAQIKGYMYVKWSEGALFGASPEEAYFIKCDEELNTPEVRATGRVLAQVGYAKKNVTEFTIISLSQKTASK